jgi:hypothetical protein
MPMDREPWEVSDAVSLVRTRLSALADGDRAAQMAAYMKTDTPFYGVPKPDRMPLFRELVKHFGPSSPGSYRSLVAAMWAEPEREARYPGHRRRPSLVGISQDRPASDVRADGR